MSGEIETKAQDTDEATITARWLREIELAGAHEKKWRERGEAVVKRYRDERDSDDVTSKFNILYANTEVLRGVVYSRTPNPDVRRRFLDKDKVGREAAQVLQRSLSYCVDSYDFDGVMNGVVEDVLLPGRGLAKARYVPTFIPMLGADGAPVLDEAGKPMQQVAYETVETDYVEWDMVRISPAKRWSKVRWVAFGELLTRDELVKQFGEAGRTCTLDWSPKDKENSDEMFKRALVWTVWDKTARKVHVVSKGMPSQRLAVTDDPLGLKDFYPCPKPIYSVSTTGTMIPIPEYTQYQDQARELDTLTARIEKLVDALRRRGLYNGTYAEIEKLANADDNKFIPVEKFSEIMEKGIDSVIWTEPVEVLAGVIQHLVQQREIVKQTIYEITGIADVVRGVSQASETLGAQELKARYANSRIGPRQKAVARFARDLYRLKAEIIAEKFSQQTLAQMTGFDLPANDAERQALQMQAGANKAVADKLAKPTWEQVVALLRNEKLRGFRVDIETDSTVQPDSSEEQKNRVELLTAVTQFVQGIGPAVQSGAVPMGLAKEMLTFGIRAFKVSPQLEDSLDAINDGNQNDKGQAQIQAAQQQIAQMMQQAQQQIAEQQQAAQAVIQQAKDAKQQAEMESMRAGYEKQLADALKSLDTEARKAEIAKELEQFKAELAAQKEIEIAKIRAGAERESTIERIQIERDADGNERGLQAMIESLPAREQAIMQMIDQMRAMMEGSKVVGIRRVRDKSGRLVGGVQIRADGTEIPVSIQ